MNGLLFALVLQSAAQPLPAAGAQELPPPPEQVMAIPDELRSAFRKEVVDATSFPEVRLEKLVAFVFDRRGLGVEYRSDATQTVSESFHSREVNCLSSTLLVLALAREAGLQAQAQQVDRVLSWGAAGETVIQSKHANAIVAVGGQRKFVVDVDASDVPAEDALNPISDEQLLALYYGNRAMELMVAGRLPEAKTWLDAAFLHAPGDVTLWNNAGVLRLRMGDAAGAEDYFLRAAGKDPRQIATLSNLVSFYRRQGDDEQVAYWRARADKALKRDPYYQFSLGRQHEQAGAYEDALRQYRRAIRLNRGERRFHFGLARVYFELGEYRKADHELVTAMGLAQGDLRGRYQDKLAALRRLRH